MSRPLSVGGFLMSLRPVIRTYGTRISEISHNIILVLKEKIAAENKNHGEMKDMLAQCGRAGFHFAVIFFALFETLSKKAQKKTEIPV